MYSMVMMMAVASGGDTASFGGRNKGCDGSSCHGTVVMASCHGGDSCHGGMSCHGSSCHGGRGGFLGLRNKSCNGCDGGRFFGKHKSCHGGESCHGGSSCHGSMPAPAPCDGCSMPAPVADPCALPVPAHSAPVMAPPAGAAPAKEMPKPVETKTEVKPMDKK